MICPNCATDNRVGAKFCMECAAAFAATCPRCGAANPAAAKFCSECAAPIAGAAAAASRATSPASAVVGPSAAQAAPVAERRLVSVLFADLVGFTPFAEERDSEEVRETLTRYFDLAGDVIGRYGGVVEKFIGDAVMAVWGTPAAHEDDAERAVRAALDLVDAVRGLGPGIGARAGVLTGEAAVTLGATNQGMVAGDLVNTAARLQSVAASGTVLVGEATQRSAASAIVFEPAGEQALRGKAAPVPAWRAVRVVAERGGRGRSDALEAPFVGRSDELRLIKDLFYATLREGRARLVSVTGIGGIGKSRLAWELEKYLDGVVDTIWWHRGRSPSYGDGLSFWALGEMVRHRAGLAEADDDATTRARIAAMLPAHVPDEAERAWISGALLALLGLESDAAPEQLFGAWRTFFERLAASGPVVLVFEDLHWADEGTLDFVNHVLEWSRNAPIFVVTLARPELLDRRPDWGAGRRSFSSIHLEPLGESAMRELLAGLVPGLPASAVDAIVARADGIPLYAVETVRMLLAQGRLVVDGDVYRPADGLADLAVPETLTALISARLDELDPSDRALVGDAAVLGQSFTLAGVAAVSGIDPANLAPSLRGLVRRELLAQTVDPRSPERGQYVFVQALIREVAYNTLAKRDRKVRHLAAARFFESLGTDELAGALAGHYLAAHGYASDGAEADALAAQARVALRGAAERAAALGSHAQAIAFLERAIEVSPAPVDRADLHARAWASAMQGIDAGVAERHAMGALAARRLLDDREATAQAAAEVAETISFFGGERERALALLRPAWEEYSDLEQTRAGVALMLGFANALALADEPATLAWVDRALPIAERLDLLTETARCMSTRAGMLYRLGRPREGLVLLRGTNGLAVANGLLDVDRNTRTSLTFFEQFNDPVAGLAMAREGLEIARRRGSTAYGSLMVGNAVSCAIRVGEWDWALLLLDEWIGNDLPGGLNVELAADRAILHALRGEDPSADLAAVGGATDAIEDPQFQSYVLLARSWAALLGGRLEEARSAAVDAVSITGYFTAISLPVGGRAALWSRDPGAAAAIAGQLRHTVSQGTAVALDHATLRAGIAALEDRRGEAVAGYRDVLRGWRGLGLAFDEAMAALDLALLLAPTERELPEAAAATEAARATFARLGARPLVERLDAATVVATRAPSGVTG